VQTNIGTHCTGVVIAPSTVLTAAHCLYNRRTRALLQAGSLHVLLGYNRGEYRWHRAVTRYTAGSGFDGAAGGVQGSDWARLELDGAIPDLVAPVPIATDLPPPGVAIALPGYNQDRSQILMADLSCHITGTATIAGKPLIAHDCDATRGTSGGPLLMRQASGWVVVRINIGVTTGASLALAATAFGD
jgi:protease YdgD